MDSENYLSTLTRRGYTYSYFYVASNGVKPTLLFLHGFPSTSRDWANQVDTFSKDGYGMIVPDLLGYGGTSAPDDVAAYKLLSMVEDIIDILDACKLEKVIGVSHDRGSGLLSRLLNTHINRFSAAAFLVVGYTPPQPAFNYEALLATMRQLVGYDVFGYWQYFAADDAPSQCEKNIDSFYSLIFPQDPGVWRMNLAPLGKVREWVEGNKQGPTAGFLDVKEHKKALMKKGLRGPLNWYTTHLTGMNNEDDSKIPQDSYIVNIPTFHAGATQDQICLVQTTQLIMSKFCTNMTAKEFNTSHWIMAEAPDELGRALGEFFSSI